MKRTSLFIILIFTAALVMAPAASGEIPEIISYQGVLSDAKGVVLNGHYDITVRIYDQSTGGEPLWEEEHVSALVNKGVFNVMLGSVNPLDVDFSVPCWLGVSVNNADELAPRLEFGSVSTALLAKKALIADNVSEGRVVKSLNGLTDNITLQAGNNVAISKSGARITFAASGGPTCNWSGWRGPTGVDCGAWACIASELGFKMYCQSGKVTRVEYITVCKQCNTPPW